MTTPPEAIPVTVDGGTLPVLDLLTGRGFITGKSGSGKSVTASVIAEELLKHDLSFLIVDTDGEYYGLKQQYEVVHAGAEPTCDVQVGVEHAGVLAELALEEGVPVILDVSGYLDEAERTDLLEAVARELFVRERTLKQPFLLVVEEVHEYLPETGGQDAFGERLLQIAKRGRKRGLGLCAISQRPAAVDKDFITQCNWLVWHRLTWNNDTDVVRRIIDADAAETVETLENGQALLQTDWDEQIRRVRFRMRETVDVGTTPDFSDPVDPDLKPVDPAIIHRLEAVTSGAVETDSAPAQSEQTALSPEEDPSTTGEQSSQTGSAASGQQHARSEPGTGSAPREPLLLEVGELMVYLFHLVSHILGRLTGWLRRRATRDTTNLRARLRVRGPKHGNRSIRDRRVYLLVIVLGVCGLLLWLLS
ncbi:MAG: ATP-binding protein [Halorientalis sp.]